MWVLLPLHQRICPGSQPRRWDLRQLREPRRTRFRSISGDQDDRVVGGDGRFSQLSTSPTNCNQHLSQSWPVLGISYSLSPSPTSPPDSSTADTSGWRKPPACRSLGAVPRYWSLCRENFSGEKAEALDKERAREGICQPVGYAGSASSSLGSVPAARGALSSASLGPEWQAPAKSQCSRELKDGQREKPKAGGWTLELTRVGGGETKHGAELSNCVLGAPRWAGGKGRRGEGRGEEGRGEEGKGGAGGSQRRERASGLSAPEQPLSATVAAAVAGQDSQGAQGVCPAAQRARRLWRLPLRPPACSLLQPARVSVGAKPPCSCSSGAGCWLRSRCSWCSSSSRTSQRSKKKSGK